MTRRGNIIQKLPECHRCTPLVQNLLTSTPFPDIVPLYVARSTHKNGLREVRSHQLLDTQKPQTCYPQNRIAKVLQLVQSSYDAQGNEEVGSSVDGRHKKGINNIEIFVFPYKL